MHVWDVTNTGSRTTVDVSAAASKRRTARLRTVITHCPTGALRERTIRIKVLDALRRSRKITVVQIAPAASRGGARASAFSANLHHQRLVSALRRMGINYIFDTNFSADLTIMEEGSEFLKRLPEIKQSGLPMFTSCCPGWVRFIKSQYPQYVSRLSTAKSPQQMFGAIAKSYYADILGVDPEKIFCISIMPCIAKKHECALDVMNDAGAGQDVDVVLTTREIDRLIRAEHIIPQDLKEEEFDSPLGVGTGAAVIFGTTGGVMEAALRSAYYLATGKNPDPDAFYAVRGMKGWKEAKFDVAGTEISVAVAHGLGNTRRLMEAIDRKEVHYDFVEIMACPGGCAGGGGQPIHEGKESAEERGENLRKLDKENTLRFSHENPS
ncbi:MAG: [Fe-Fe] hydrogenase large subunit C-terminal domain-containing protein, partial [Christensenellaceae bacterium]